MRAFVITSGVLLALFGFVGAVQTLSLLASSEGQPLTSVGWEWMAVCIVFLIAGIAICSLSKRVGASSHWVFSLIGGVCGFIVTAVVKVVVQAMTVGI